MSSFLEGKRKTDTILVSMHSLPKKIREMEAVADDLVNRSTQEEDPVDTKRLSSDADKRKFVEDRRLRPVEEKKQREDKDLCECATRAEDEADKLREEEKKKKKPERKGKQPQNKVKAPETKPKEEVMKQQGQAAKRPQTPAPPTQQRYPPREVPPRFMTQAQKKMSNNKQKGQNDTESIGRGEMNGGGSGYDTLVVDGKDRYSWPSIGGDVANCSSDSPWGAPGNMADTVGGGGVGGCCATGSESANPCGHGHGGPTGSCSSSSSSGSGCDVTCVPSSSATSSTATTVATTGGACVGGGGGVGGAVSSSGNAIASSSTAVVTNLANAGNSNITANAVGGASGGSCGSVITSSSPAVEGQWPSEASNGNGSSTSQGQGSNATLLLASHLCSGSSSSNTCSNSCSASLSPAASAAINPTGTRNTNTSSHHGQAQQQQQQSSPQVSPMDAWGTASNLYRTLNSQANSGNNNNSNAAPANQQGESASSHQDTVWGSRPMRERGNGADNGFAPETSSVTENNSGEWRDSNAQAVSGAQQNGEQGGNGNCNSTGSSNGGSNPNQSEGHMWGASVVNNSNCSVAGGGLLNDNGTSGWGNSANTASGYGARNGANDGWGTSQGQWGSSPSPSSGARICAPPNNNCGQGLSGVKPKGTWAQAACKGLSSSTNSDNGGSCNVNSNANNGGHNNNSGNNCMPVIGGHQANETSTKKPEESDARVLLTSHDGWGLGGVNQDTVWDVPGVQEPAAVLKDPAVPVVCRSTVSNGTEIWENSLRNGKGNSSGGNGSGSNPAVQQPPWGNNPTTNIGGMWGEDEDTSNVWTGMPSNSANAGNATANNATGGMHGNNCNSNSAMWGSCSGAPPANDRKDKWGPAAPSPAATGWGDSNMSSSYNGASWSSPASSSMAKPAQQQASVAPSGHPGQGIGVGPSPNANVSGNVSGHHGQANLPRIPSSSAVAGGVGPKEVKPTGWEEPSPPTPRRGVPNYDDGTSVWGNPHSQGKNPVPPPSVGSAGVIRIPTANTGLKGDPGTAIWGKPNSRSNSWNDGNAHDSMSSGWDEGPSIAVKGNCVASGGGGSGGGSGGNGGGRSAGGWGEPGSPHSWSSKPKVSNWGDGQVVDTSNWGAPAAKQGGKLLTKDLIWASRQFRILCDLGFKKEDVENALRNNNMNFEDAMNDLNGNSGSSRDGNLDGHEGFGGMHSKMRAAEEEMNSIDASTFNPNMGNVNNAHLFPSPVSQPGPFNKSQGVGMNSLSGHHGNANANSAQIPNINLAPIANALNPAMIQKILTMKHQYQQQQQVPQFPNLGQSFGGQDRVSQQSIPSTAQLRLIVQQIQTAVQAGHLNPQILNQPMAPQTLLLVNQLLQQIKHLQQLTTQQQLAQQHPAKSGANTALQLSVQITKTKQQITNLQNQITVQQAVFSKQQQQQMIQQQQQQQAMSNDFLLKPQLDPLALIQGGVQELALKEQTPTTPTQQSRLHQWKLPSIDKDLDHPTSPNSGPPPPLPMQPMTHSHAINTVGVGEFSRAPGSIAKPTSLPQPLPSSLNTLFSQVDNTWTRSSGESGWPDSSSAVGSGSSVVSVGDSSVNGDKESQWSLSSSLTPSSNQPSYNITDDLVAEFEPGKPWKGVPLKNIEDDPHITPGSVARSPLNSIKESDIFNSLNKSSSVSSASDSTYPPLSITNTWSFNSGTTASSPSYSSSGSVGGSPGCFQKKWPSESHQHPHPPSSLTSELWGPPISKGRWQPPPGMGNSPGGMKVMGVGGSVPVGPSGGLGSGVGGSNAPNSSPSNSWGPPVNSVRSGWNPDGGRNSFPPASSSGWDRQAVSTWLMLRNLTPQIDGSTLKTLCMQHGPLVAFHLYLNQGIALVRYSSREEASKAQNALNSCVLGNTTIFADFANESDMNQFLQQSGHTMNANRSMTNNTWGGPLPNPAPGSGIVGSASNSTVTGTGTAVAGRSSGGNQHQGSSSAGFKGDPMSASHWNGANLNVHANAIWSMPSPGILWGSPNANEHDQHRATPSSLHSFLPGDLLGGESV